MLITFETTLFRIDLKIDNVAALSRFKIEMIFGIFQWNLVQKTVKLNCLGLKLVSD